MTAARCGHIKAVRKALADGADIRNTGFLGESVLAKALTRKITPSTVAMVRLLLEAGADPNGVSNYPAYVPALYHALRGICEMSATDRQTCGVIIDILVEAGADPCVIVGSPKRPTLLHMLAYHPESEAGIERLIAIGAQVNALDKNGNTPLHWIASAHSLSKSGRLEKNMTALLEAGADSTIRNHNGKTAYEMLLACERAEPLVDLCNSWRQKTLLENLAVCTEDSDHGPGL